MTADTLEHDDAGFPGLRSLGPRGEEAERHFRELEQELQAVGAHADAGRLRALDDQVRTTSFATLEQLAAPDLLVDSLSAERRGTARTWTGVRNVAALLPLLTTWLFLAWSAYEYQRELAAHPAKVDTPFLLLWEQRFDGAAIPSFSATAVITVVLLVAVLGLTVLAHLQETGALRAESRGAALVDTAMNALRAAVDFGAPTAPASAQDWAHAAQQILTNTQRAIEDSVVQTRDLVTANREITESAQQTLVSVRADAQAFVEQLSAATLAVVEQTKEENKQFIDRTSQAAVEVLEKALESNRVLIKGELTPLVQDFRTTLEDFVRHHETYRDSARLLAESARSMDESARVLAGSAKSYTQIASSIDDHLRILEGTQRQFVDRVTSSADSMRSAADTMLTVSTALSTDVKNEIEQLARNVVAASADVASINTSLVGSSAALDRATTALDTRVVRSLDGLVTSLDAAAENLRTVHRTKWLWWR
jgi:hypothetical protein